MKYYLILIAVMSLVTFALYGADKGRAKRGDWRIPEKVLLLASLFGGAVGGFLAMQLFRHKTKHAKFTVLVPVLMAVHLGLLVYLLE